MVNEDDIQYVYSGGNNNANPLESLGGDPSAHSILTGVNNLFSDLDVNQTTEGKTDYRCFYIFNNNSTDTFYDTEIWIESEEESGTSIEMGMTVTNEIQKIFVVGTVTGGSITLDYDGTNCTFSWNSSLNTWATNLQTALNTFLSEVTVTVAQDNTTVIFEITFSENEGNRYQPLLTLVTNGLSGPTLPSVTITRLVAGGPINTTAVEIDVDTTIPNGVTFSYPTATDPLVLGDLKPTEGFPVWIKRICAAGASAVAEDGFKIRFSGSPV